MPVEYSVLRIDRIRAGVAVRRSNERRGGIDSQIELLADLPPCLAFDFQHRDHVGQPARVASLMRSDECAMHEFINRDHSLH